MPIVDVMVAGGCRVVDVVRGSWMVGSCRVDSQCLLVVVVGGLVALLGLPGRRFSEAWSNQG